MKIAAMLNIESGAVKVALPIKAAAMLTSGDIRLTVDAATKQILSKLVYFPVHTIVMVVGDFDCSLVVERKGAYQKSMVDYEENSMCFEIANQSEAGRIFHAVAKL